MSQPAKYVLAGGGHSHALLLRTWAMHPKRRPRGLITLVSRHSTTLYSGMVPGLMAGLYQRHDLEINLRLLADQAGVALLIAEITGIDRQRQVLFLAGRPPLNYDELSLNLGCVTPAPKVNMGDQDGMAIKPLEPAISAVDQVDTDHSDAPVQLIGSGLAAIELAMAFRHRWPNQRVQLQAKPGRISPAFQQALAISGVDVHQTTEPSAAKRKSPAKLRLRCTGSHAPTWLAESGLQVDARGRVRTDPTLQALDNPNIFASGDCAVIDAAPRPSSGVWAVRATAPLAHNLEARCSGQPLRSWRPQRHALQLLGGFDPQGEPTAWGLWGSFCFGPHPWLWRWKQSIDRRFMSRFARSGMAADHETSDSTMLCRGCAAKVSADILQAGLDGAGLGRLGTAPEDAALVPFSDREQDKPLLQSVDGFPALISDPWLNGRLTALHACSDLWACGADVSSGQAVVTLPLVEPELQQFLLTQTLAGIRSALDPQQATLIGGHTLEARESSPAPCSLGIQVVLSVQGCPIRKIWPKQGIQANDQLLLSRPLGTGVLFAAAMTGASKPADLDRALTQMGSSQHPLVDQLAALEARYPGEIHAVTDITGFGLLGHLGEMLGEPDDLKPKLQVQLEAKAIPALPGSLDLLASGHASSLAPANRRAWDLLDPQPSPSGSPAVTLNLGLINKGSSQHKAVLELLVDPQTCGPLLISVTESLSKALLKEDPKGWWPIGRAIAN